MFNYVDKILAFLTTYLPQVDICEEIRQNLHTVDIFSTTYLPRRVNVVCELPLALHSKLLHLVVDVSQGV